MPVEISTIRFPERIIFGRGARKVIPEVMQDLRGKHALVVTSPDLTGLGKTAEIVDLLNQGGIQSTVWDQVEQEPTTGNVDQGVEIARSAGCDLVLGFGGGSSLDTAKGIAVLLTNPGSVEAYLGSQLVKQRGAPTVMLPTTAGTGAEVTQNALFFVEAEQAKQAIISPLIIPDAAIVDPELALSLPPHLTASTGFDALCHAIECYTGKNSSPLGDLYALEAIRLISTHLRDAIYQGESIAAREGMAKASLFAGLAIVAAGTNGVHALSYPLQGICHIPHGVANAVLLPYVMEFNLAGDVRRFASVAEALGQPAGVLPLRDTAQQGVEIVRKLSQDAGLPQRIGPLGVDADLIPELVSGALSVTRLLVNNPRPMLAEDIQAVFQRAL